MENKNRVTTTIPEILYTYLGSLGKEWFNLNKRLIVQNAYDYCTELPEQELDFKMSEVASKYYKLFTHKMKTRLVHVDTVEPMKKYQSNILITLYILVFLHDHKEELNINEEILISV